jgi:hypothetical protein
VAILTMLPRALASVTIVAAFPVWLHAAPPISEDAPVPAEVAAVGRMLGLDPPRDRARFVSEFARLLYTAPLGKSPAVAALIDPKLLDPGAIANEQPMQVPVPLTADVWSRAILKRPTKPDRLVAAILADRRAALLCYGLSALDDETLAYFADHSSLLTSLYESAAPAFAAFGASLRVRGNRVVPPGNAEAAAIWEAIVQERVSSPEAFVRALFQRHEGRVAYLYDTIDQLDPPAAAFVLGSWMPDQVARAARFEALVDVCARSYKEWRLETLPFSKPLHDLSLLFMRLRVEPDGVPVAPASRAFWSEVFSSDDLNVAGVSPSGDPAAQAPIDAAWLVTTTSGSDMFWRGDRIDQFAFGQRRFAGTPPDQWPAAIVAIRAFPRQRMLSLTLERMGIQAPAVYASIARHASRVTGGNPNHLFWTLAQLQSSLALVARMKKAGTLTASAAERLVSSLFALPAEGDRYAGAVAGWLQRELLPLMPAAPESVDPSEVVETRLIAGLAGTEPPARQPRVFWEGEQYRVDPPAAERNRLKSVRQKQQGYSIDAAIALNTAARTLASEGLTLDQVREVSARLGSMPQTFGRRLTAPSEARAPGVEELRPSSEWLEKFNDDLARSVRSNDVRRAARLSPAIREHVDAVLAVGLLSLAYAADLGDPEGAAMLARNVAMRHDFGFGRKDGDVRARSVWAVPRQDFLPGVPWHVTGSVLGLDMALAPLSLRRISPDHVADAPRLSSNEREAFAVGLALMDTRQLTDRDRDAIVSAVARGWARVDAVASGAEPLEAVAAALRLDGRRRRELAWMIANDRDGIPRMFSLVEVMALGGTPRGANLDAWGTSALQSEGCACTRLTAPRAWRLLSGRPQMAFMAAGIPDLNLHIALALADLRMPANLAPAVLSAAVLDFIEGVGPTDPNDWWSVARAAREVPRELIEDYIAAAAAVDGPLVPDDTESNQP